MRLPPLDLFSFWVGAAAATILWWVVNAMRPLLRQAIQEMRHRREAARERSTSSVELNHRRATLRQAQGMHLAAPLFALNEILQPPRLLAPPPHVEPDGPIYPEDTIAETIPYLPAWPELAAVYGAPTLTLPEALSGGCNLVITGQAGTGKTVALAHLASLAANRDPQLGALSHLVPILVHIADMNLPAPQKDILTPIVDAVATHAPVLDLPRLPGFIHRTFHSGRALFLLDGLDELPPDGIKTAVEYLRQLIAAYPGTHIVTTSCPEQLDGLLSLDFVPLTIMPWGPKERREFLERWADLWTRYIATESWAQTDIEPIDPLVLTSWLETDPLILTPLELTLKTWAAYAGDSRGPTALDSIETHLLRLAPPDVPAAALETLAMQVVLTTQPVFDPRKARQWVKSFEPPEEKEKPSPEKKKRQRKGKAAAPTPGILAKMAESGLLISHPDNRMRFVHPVLEGYLAGRALTAYEVTDTLLQQPDWSGKLLAMHYLAAHGDAGPLADALLEQSTPPLESALFIPARWLRDAPRKAPWRGKVLAALANLIKEEGLPLALRGQALTALALSGDPGTPALFRAFLKSQFADQARLAALGSGMIRDAKAIEILGALFRMEDIYARRAACLALVAIGTEPALELVATALLQGDEDLRRAAAEALANHPAEGHAMLRDGIEMEDILVRRAVVYGLGRLDAPWARQILEKVQIEDDQWVVRNAAGELLESKDHPNLRVPRPLPPPSEAAWLIAFAGTQNMGIAPGSSATDVLLLALKQGSIEERLASIPYLQKTPTEGVLSQLYQALYGDDLLLREAVFHALWELAASGVALPHPQTFGLH